MKERAPMGKAAAEGLQDVHVRAVDSGVVLLEDKTKTRGDELAAIEHAHRGPGVPRVASGIDQSEES